MAVYVIIKKAAAKARIDRRVYPHLLRHTKLTQLGNENMNPFALQRFDPCYICLPVPHRRQRNSSR